MGAANGPYTYILYNMRRILASRKTPFAAKIYRGTQKIYRGTQKEKSDSSKNISNFPPIIKYTIFVQIAIPEPKKFGNFSAKLLSIFLTIYWKSVFRSVIMDYADMIYVMQTRHQFGR